MKRGRSTVVVPVANTLCEGPARSGARHGAFGAVERGTPRAAMAGGAGKVRSW